MSDFPDFPPHAAPERALDPVQDNIELAFALRQLARTTADLERVERCWRALTEALEEGVILLDERGRVIAVNRSATVILGEDAEVRSWIWGDPDAATEGTPQPIHRAMGTLLDGDAGDPTWLAAANVTASGCRLVECARVFTRHVATLFRPPPTS